VNLIDHERHELLSALTVVVAETATGVSSTPVQRNPTLVLPHVALGRAVTNLVSGHLGVIIFRQPTPVHRLASRLWFYQPLKSKLQTPYNAEKRPRKMEMVGTLGGLLYVGRHRTRGCTYELGETR
jgi:hypothetical protein